MEPISAAIATFSAMKTIASGLVSERDALKAAELKTDLIQRITEAQGHLLELLGTSLQQAEELRASKARVAELEREKTERDRYRLVRLSDDGAENFVLALKPPADLVERADEPPHLLCSLCFDAGRKAVLQGEDRYSRWVWVCRVCKRDFYGPRALS